MENSDVFPGQKEMIDNYRKELLLFYKPHFKNEDDFYEFVDLAFNYEEKYSSVRYMIQQVQRFVSLANDIAVIRPARDPLRIFFLKTCLESLCKISSTNKNFFFDKFEKCFSEQGKNYILSNFKYTGITIPDNLPFDEEREKYYCFDNQSFTLTNFLRIIKATRDMVAHDGDYWSMQIFAHDDDSTWLTSISTKERIFEDNKEEMTYNFSTTLQYSRFIFYFVEACINYINTHNVNRVVNE